MTFSIQRGPLGYSIPSALKAMNRVIIGIINGIMPEPLIDGIITHVFYPVFPPDRNAGDVLSWLRANPK